MGNQKKNEDSLPLTINETLDQVSQSLEREANGCYGVYEKRLSTNPGNAAGFLKRGQYMERQFNLVSNVAIRLRLISDIMVKLYAVPFGEIDLTKVELGKHQTKLLEDVRVQNGIPSVINSASLGTIFVALQQYPM